MIKKHCTLLVKNSTPNVEISSIPQYFSELYEKYQVQKKEEMSCL